MRKPYFLDLRERICACVAQGNSARPAGRLFGVWYVDFVESAAIEQEISCTQFHQGNLP